ncbi:UDP-N-acetylmuramoyl-L-alanyl-D-glutamate--2,6-diaminopimelate ligase [bacterium]|nr:UDP-N-acetylmuramoyl-L-alanyl-D-glutamate--2,6-diaminopimelate ligase [bacterium]
MKAVKKIYWHLKAWVANLIFGYPAKSLKIIGVTGTNGKTTTCFYLDSILQAAGLSTARMTTVDYHLNDSPKVNPVHLTTFDAFRLQRFLKQAKQKKINWVVLELSSHGLAQDRALGIELEGGVITYVSREHLDFHISLADYFRAKAKILAMIKPEGFAVLNRDDRNFNYFKSRLNGKKLLTFGLLRGDIRADRVKYQADGVDFLLVTPLEKLRVKLKLPGRFNLYNALAASAVAYGLGIKGNDIRKGLENLDYVPGRMEEIKVKNQPFRLVVDYVHTPDALALVLEEMRQSAKGRLIIVFGMPGERDPSNRPLMGEVAQRADIVIITNENPRSEKPEDIINQIASGVKNKQEGKNLFKIVDRKKAIKKAIELAQAGDLILVAGKGPENYIETKKGMIPWDDRLVSRQLIKEHLAQQKDFS